MMPWPVAALASGLLVASAGVVTGQATTRMLDGFEKVSDWTAVPSDGATMKLSAAPGRHGQSLRIDFDLTGGGYVIVRRTLDLTLPTNYEFGLQVRGRARRNNLEFKLVDPSGENVWWSNQRRFAFPAQWQQMIRKRRHISFAWGPAGGGQLERVGAIELAITAGDGGRGTVWLDDLTITTLPDPPATTPPVIASGASSPANPAPASVDGDSSTAWRSPNPTGSLLLDLGVVREFGGLTIVWADGKPPARADVEASRDGRTWQRLGQLTAPWGPASNLWLPESDARYLRLTVRSRAALPGISEVAVRPLTWAESPNDFAVVVARAAPRGIFPRAISGEPSYWTAFGADRDSSEALLNTDGVIEPFSGGFSLEPLVTIEGRTYTWASVSHTTFLEGQLLPFPVSRWEAPGWTLDVAPFAPATDRSATIYARYILRNRSATPLSASLGIALRPFQVNPPWQFLQTPGGISEIHRISRRGTQLTINGDRQLQLLTAPSSISVSTYDRGDIVARRLANDVVRGDSVSDPSGRASALLGYDLLVAPGDSQVVVLAAPSAPTSAALPLAAIDSVRQHAMAWWTAQLNEPLFALPDEAQPLLATLRASLASILLMRDGSALRPGARSYARSWIRDGAMMSAALLRAGMADVVRTYADWYAPFQYANGKIPCCVDDRGADPVPEHDSHGEFIYLIAEYVRYTGDRAFAVRHWPAVVRAMQYIGQLRAQRLTPEFRNGPYYGIMPPSISHEGYSAKPMHSYWDDFWTMRGLKDAAWLSEWLGTPEANEYRDVRDAVRTDLGNSIQRSMQLHRVPYIPGAADLGDFDATSTTIAVSPVDELGYLPAEAVDSTFDRFYQFFRARRDGQLAWENYTPYELRLMGTMIRLGYRDRAMELAEYYLKDQRPSGWRQWAEVVWRDSTATRFIGDLPHAWVASDFVRSFFDVFAFERERDRTLILGAGIPAKWLDSRQPVSVRGLRTQYGVVDLTLQRMGDVVEVSVSVASLPPSGLVLALPFEVLGETFRDPAGRVIAERSGSTLRLLQPATTLTVPIRDSRHR